MPDLQKADGRGETNPKANYALIEIRGLGTKQSPNREAQTCKDRH
jgi:hypothetical protein